MANFAMQTNANDQSMHQLIKRITRRWQVALVAYIRHEIKVGHISAEISAASLARRMLICFPGAITKWKLSGDLKYYDEAITLSKAGLLVASE